ncbi:MAG: DEAD/DEAH box helicase [bacterium]|nr:DEAD/DEAH box helicase [bacterium]
MNEQTKNFEKLLDEHKKIFALLLMYGLPVSMSRFLQTVSFAGLKNLETGKNLTSMQLGDILRRVENKGLISGRTGHPWHVEKQAQSLLGHPFVQENYNHWLPDIQKALNTALKSHTSNPWDYRSLSDDMKEALVMQPFKLILHNPEYSNQQKKLAFQEQLQSLEQNDQLVQEFYKNLEGLSDSPQKIWPVLDDKQKFLFFASHKARVLALDQEIVSLEKLTKDDMPDICWFALAELYMLMGNLRKAGSILENTGSAHVRFGWINSLNGLHKYLEGDRTGAIELFEQALREYKKQTRKRKDYFPYTAGLFYVLAMMQEDIDKYHARIKAFLTVGQVEQSYDRQYFRLLDLIFKNQDEEREEFSYADRAPSENWLKGSILDVIVYTVLMCWGNNSTKLKILPLWSKTKAKLQAQGFEGILHHLTDLTEQKKGAVLAPPRPVGEDWQRALTRLEQLVHPKAGKTAAKKSNEARVAWLVTCEEHYSTVQPKLQKRTKAGGWTKGRNIALKKLAKGAFTEAELSVQDMKIISCIEVSYDYNGWGNETSYEVDAQKAIPLLAGHPAAIALDGRPVEINVSVPDLVIKKNRDESYSLTFSQTIPAKPGSSIKKRNDHRIEVLEISAQHCEIVKKIGPKLTVPHEGVKQLQSLVSDLAPLVPVQSDLAGTSNELSSVEACSTLQVHLGPVDEGFAAEFLVEPIDKSGKLFHPGKGGGHILVELGSKKLQTERDLKKEHKHYRDVLHSSDVLRDMEEEPFRFYADGPRQCLELLDALKSCDPQTVNVKWPEGEKLRLHQQLNFSQLSINIKKSGTDWFEVSGEIEIDDKTMMSIAQLLKHVDQSSSRFLDMGEKGFLALEQNLFAQLKRLSGIAQDDRVHALASSVLAEIGENAGKLKSSKYWKDHQSSWERSFDQTHALPSTLQADLRDYQLVGFNWLARLSSLNIGACLADDMGLGKTMQALAILLSRAKNGPALVVAPVSVVPNWIDEMARFAPTLSPVWMIGGAAKRKKMLQELGPFDVVLCSYGVLAPDQENLAKVNWDMVVLDEAQAIKNHTTKRASAAFSLKADFKLVTTGTPMENHLGELWSIFRFITPGFLGSYDKFTQRFITPIEGGHETNARATLKSLIQPFILRRKKSEVLTELPPKTEITLNIELSPQERAFYESLRRDAVEKLATLADQKQPSHVKILAEIMRLRRACCHPRLVDEKLPLDSAKFEQLQNLLRELRAGDHKVLIFSQFVGHLALIKDWLDEVQISYQYLDGSTPVKKRQRAVRDFQNGEGDCFLISLRAGGSGLNLTAANYVIHMDPWWNPAVEDQASDRAHRIGQKQPVTIYRLVVKDSIEEKILALHKTKRDLADTLLEGTDQTGRISASELMNLLAE